MSRRKANALDVPASEAEAAELVTAYVAGERQILDLRLNAERAIDATKAERDARLAELGPVQKDRFARVKAWWEAGGAKLAGERRSAELAGARIGVRLTPPTVKFARGLGVKAVLALIHGLSWGHGRKVLRTKIELDKPGLIKLVQADQPARDLLADKGVTVVQVDEFFIDAGLDETALRSQPASEGADA